MSVDTREKRITAYTYEIQKDQKLWSQTVEEHILTLTPSLERKRQETIFELIYTELDFLRDLNYIITVRKMEGLYNWSILRIVDVGRAFKEE